jgi:acetylornithine deacetylase
MSASVHQKLLRQVDESRERAIKFLQDMIAIPSITGDEANIQKFLSTT